jgi:hypothetical protein
MPFFPGIKFFFVNQEDVLSTEKLLEERFSLLKRFWAHKNCLVLFPLTNTTLRVYDLSQRSISQSVKAYDTDGDESSSGLGNADSTEILPGCAYVGVWGARVRVSWCELRVRRRSCAGELLDVLGVLVGSVRSVRGRSRCSCSLSIVLLSSPFRLMNDFLVLKFNFSS